MADSPARPSGVASLSLLLPFLRPYLARAGAAAFALLAAAGLTLAVGQGLRHIIDDGAVIYLNGSELVRLRLPDGQITANTLATPFVDNAELEGPVIIPAPTLLAGENLLAVEVHQSVANSSDIVMGLEVAEASSAGISATVMPTSSPLPSLLSGSKSSNASPTSVAFGPSVM